MTTLTATIPSPYGDLSVTEKNGAIIAVDWETSKHQQTSPLLDEACIWE